MGILNPVLWIFIFLWIAALSAVCLLVSVPVGIIVFFFQQRGAARPRALRMAVITALLAFGFLFLAGCVIAVFCVQGPLAL